MSESLQPATATREVKTRPEGVAPDRAANVQRILENITRAKHHWKPDFERMRSDMDFASGLQWADQKEYEDERYRLNLVLRHVRLRTAQLYAKNPKAIYKRKQRMDFALWDEKPESIMLAMQEMMLAQQMAAQAPPEISMMGHNGGPPMVSPMTMQLIQDYQQGMERRAQAERLGRTLELLWSWFLSEPIPNVKVQMKAMVRRAVTTGVGYVKLGFQRQMQPRPDQATRIADLTQQLATIERLRANLMGEEATAVADYDAEAEQLRQAIAALQEQPEVILREGPMLDFPRATSIIPDPRTRSLVGWIGAGWVAEEFELSCDQVEEIYGVRVSKGANTEYARGSVPPAGNGLPEPGTVRFWQYYDKATGRMYTVAEGWPDYLEEPRAPEVDLERFFPYYVLAFNEIEHEKRIFPPSDVELIRSPQDEYNRLREGLRQHRIANRPLYAAATGAFDKKDTENLSGYPAHAVVTLNSLNPGDSVQNLLQPVAKVPIDPNVYEVEGLFSDTLRATGSQEANFGGSSGATATEVAEASRSGASTTVSDTDDLDEMLTDLARDFGIVCLLNMAAETVKRLVGPGAMWPQLSKGEIIAEGALEVEAGSSGRPNRERDLANFERIAPFVLQVPGIKPEKLARHVLKLLDDNLDLNDFIDPGLPSITAMNAAKQPATGDAATDPNQQGDQGANNAPAPDQRPGGPQPAYGPSGNAVG
jgi:hypothetical protein